MKRGDDIDIDGELLLALVDPLEPSAALQVACAIKSVSSVKWCPSLSSARVVSCLRCRRACAVCNASAAAALEDEAAAPGVSDTACRNVKVVKLHCPHI